MVNSTLLVQLGKSQPWIFADLHGSRKALGLSREAWCAGVSGYSKDRGQEFAKLMGFNFHMSSTGNAERQHSAVSIQMG